MVSDNVILRRSVLLEGITVSINAYVSFSIQISNYNAFLTFVATFSNLRSDVKVEHLDLISVSVDLY